MTYNANGRIGDEDSVRRLTPCLIDLAAIDDPDWGGGRRADAPEFDPLRNQRTGDEDRFSVDAFLFLDRSAGEGATIEQKHSAQTCCYEI